MASIDIYSMDPSEMIGHANFAFTSAIGGLVAFGEVTPEQADRILRRYTVIVTKRGLFGRAIDKFFKADDKDGLRYQLVQLPPEAP